MILSQVAIRYGGLHLMWSYHEQQLEIISAWQLGITPRQAHIIFSSLGYKPKKEIAISLLKEAGDKADLINAIHTVSQIAKRNHLTHSMVSSSEKIVRFTKRDIQNGLVAKEVAFDSESINKMFEELRDAIDKIGELAGISELNMNSYGSHLVAEKAPPNRG